MNRQLEFSRLVDHNRYERTDRLYDPLRRVLIHPETTQAHQQSLPPAAMNSRVSHDYAYLRPQQAYQIRDHTYIPINKQLQATHDLSKVRGKQFMVVDANKKVIGNPISEQEMNIIRSQGMKEEKILYDFGRPDPLPAKGTYRSPPLQYFHDRQRYKYNLYSVIDEPANLIKESGCGACTCPGNEIIASRNEPQSLGWLN